MKKHDYVRSNLTYWLDDKIQSQVYNFLQKIPRKQAVFVSLLVHKYLSENYDGHLEDITAKEADWLYKWLLLKQHADNMGLDITPYKHIFKKIVELQPEASIETIWNSPAFCRYLYKMVLGPFNCNSYYMGLLTKRPSKREI